MLLRHQTVLFVILTILTFIHKYKIKVTSLHCYQLLTYMVASIHRHSMMKILIKRTFKMAKIPVMPKIWQTRRIDELTKDLSSHSEHCSNCLHSDNKCYLIGTSVTFSSKNHLAENDWGGLTVTEFWGSHGMEEGKGESYLASGRQYGNALLGVRHQEEEVSLSIKR